MADRINYEVNFSATGVQALWNEYLAGGESAGRALNQALGGKVKKELVLEVKADDSGVKKLVASEREVLTELQKIINLQDKANKTQEGSVTSLRQQVNQAKQARDGMVKYAASADNVRGKLGTINGAWAAQNERVRNLQRQLDIAGASNVWQKLAAEYNLKGLAGAGRQITELVNVFQSVSIIIGQVIGSVNQLFDVLQKLQSIELTFQGIGAGTDISAVFAESNRIALGLGVSLNTIRDSFQQLSPVILATGGNIGDVSAVTESLSSRFVTFGLSADKSRRVLNGVVQAFSKGKLMAEELTQQISEADPAFRTDLAQAIGVTVKELGDMVKAGEVTNQVLLEAIPRMSKVGGLFGRLGTTALDAARGFRAGAVTVEQFRSQLGNIGQLAIEDLVNPDTGPLQPLLASLFELTAIVTDVTVAFAKSEVFETFLNVLGSVVSQVSLVVQALVTIGGAIASITQPIFAAINFVDKLGGALEGFGIISTVVAAIITTKLVVALGSLAAGAATNAAIAGIGALTKAVQFFSSTSITQLIASVGRAIVSFVGLGAATRVTAVAEGISTTAAGVRAKAVANLTRLLGLQAVADLGAAKAAGINAKAQAGAAGIGAAAKVPGYLPPLPPIGPDAGKAVGNVDKLKVAVGGLGRALAGLLANPYVLLFAALAIGIGGFVVATGNAREASSKFDSELKKIRTSVDVTNKSLNDAKGVDTFTARLDRLDEAAKKNAVLNSSGQGFDFGGKLFGNINIDGLISAAKRFGTEVTAETNKATQAVGRYNEATDKSGNAGLRAAAQIAAAESTVGAALRITKAEREKLIAEQEKAPGLADRESIAKIRLYDAEIKKLGQQRVAVAQLRQEAAAKGIPVSLDLDRKEAETKLATFSEQIKGLKASIIVESDPEKRAKLQGELSALEAQLKFIQDNPVEVKIEAEFKVNSQALKDAADFAKSTQESLESAVELGQALFKLDIGKVSGAEQAIQSRIDDLKDELDRLKDAGVKEGAGTKAIDDRIRKEEEKLKQLAEEKRQIEIKAIQAKLTALPAIQAAERESLRLQQEMTKLELERLRAKAAAAKIEGIQLANKLNEERARAVKRGDTEAVADIDARLNSQTELLKYLTQEETSLNKQIENLGKINKLQNDSLTNKQAAQTADLQAELASKGAATAQGQAAVAAGQAAVASGNAATNAAAYAQAAEAGAKYSDITARAATSAAGAMRGTAQAAIRATGAVKDTATAAQNLDSISANIGLDISTTQDLITSAKIAGGDYTRTLADTISKGKIFAPMMLNTISNAVGDYRSDLEMLARTQQDAKVAQDNYDNALRNGGGNLVELATAVAVTRTNLAGQTEQMRISTEAYNSAANAAKRLGIDINTVTAAGSLVQDTGPKTLEESYVRARDAALGLGTAIKDTSTGGNLDELSEDVLDAGTAFGDAAGSLDAGQQPAANISGSLANAAEEAQKIVDGFANLDGSSINVRVNYVGQPGLWTGGPTVGGQTYRINELGQEGFLSSSGALSAINKPRNALWKAPGRGTVIPAHIMSSLDIPTGRVSTGVRPAAVGTGGNGMGRLVRAIQNALMQTNKSDPGLQEMASVQAHQAQQIGKLSRAVTKLADKDWNVNVGVRNTGSTAYLDALNRRM